MSLPRSQSHRPESLLIAPKHDRLARSSIESPPFLQSSANDLIALISTNFSDWKDSFLFLDKRHRGWVSDAELRMILYRHEVELDQTSYLAVFNAFSNENHFVYGPLLEKAKSRIPQNRNSEIESLQKKLQEVIDRNKISPTMLFLQFDVNQNSRVSAEEIFAYFRALGVKVSKKNMRSLVSQYTSDPEGLNYSQFVSLLLPTSQPKPDNSNSLVFELAILLLPLQYDLHELLKSQDRFDTGSINKQEFESAVTHILAFFTNQELSILFDSLDSNQTGSVNYRDIWSLMENLVARAETLTLEERNVIEHFKDEFFDETDKVERYLRRSDTDSDGLISIEELSQALHRLGIAFEREKLEPIFRNLDSRKNGKISTLEVLRAIQRSIWESS